MSFFSFLKRNKESYSLVFNIGSGSVSGGIIKFTEKPGVDITHYAKQTIPFQQEVSVPLHLEKMKESLETLAKNFQSEGFKKINVKKGEKKLIEKVFLVFSSPWSVSQTKTIRIKEPKPFKVTEGYLNNLIDQQEKQFQTEISKTGKVIEKKIIQVKINGYIVSDFYNKNAKELEVSVFLTVVPEEILNTVEKAILKAFSVDNFWCHSLSLASFSVIRNLFPHKEDFVCMDISEEVTDISIIKDNIVTNTASIPFGRNHYLRELSTLLKVSEEIADSMIRTHCLKSNDELANIKLSVAMDKAAISWLEKINEVLNSVKEKVFAFDTLFFIANSDLVCFLKNKLEKQDFKVLLVDNKKIKSSVVSDDVIFKIELMFLDKLYKI